MPGSSIQATSPSKFKKAMSEFTKATEGRRGDVPDPEGTRKLWEEFLEERYDGGKEKARNPNPDTRDSHPEISVSYLMRQDRGPYQAQRRQIRREFAAWVAERRRPAAVPGHGIFAPF